MGSPRHPGVALLPTRHANEEAEAGLIFVGSPWAMVYIIGNQHMSHGQSSLQGDYIGVAEDLR